jgi:hypothetical protein
MLQAGARLCKCLGEEFLPYMEIVMPPLLRSAQLRPDVQITDADSDAEDEEDEEVWGWPCLSVCLSVSNEQAAYDGAPV